MQAGRLPESVAVFSDVIARAPGFAEGWNKRATAYYLMGELDRSLADCEEVVKRNPVHFGALSGFGLIYLQKEDLPKAAEYFEKALAVDPTLDPGGGRPGADPGGPPAAPPAVHLTPEPGKTAAQTEEDA